MLLQIKKKSVPRKRETIIATAGGSINHGLDEAGVGGEAVPGGVLVREIEMVDGAMIENKTKMTNEFVSKKYRKQQTNI